MTMKLCAYIPKLSSGLFNVTIISYEISRHLVSINATRKYSTSYKESITTPLSTFAGLPIAPINP